MRIYLSIYLSIYPSIHPSIHPSIYPSICLHIGARRHVYRVQPAPGEAGDAVHHQHFERSRTRAGAARRGAARAGDVAARMIVLGHSRPMYIRTKKKHTNKTMLQGYGRSIGEFAENLRGSRGRHLWGMWSSILPCVMNPFVINL